MGQLGKGIFGFLGRFPAENDYGTVHFLNFYDKFFESTVRRQNLEILTEHKPAWNHVTRTPAKSQKQQRPLALLPAMVG